jgi:hypothetical protein
MKSSNYRTKVSISLRLLYCKQEQADDGMDIPEMQILGSVCGTAAIRKGVVPLLTLDFAPLATLAGVFEGFF